MGQRAWMAALLLHAGRPADALYFTQRWLEADETPPGSGFDFAPPRLAPLTTAQLKQVNKFPDLQMIHSAALAAFTVSGDSELERQYLHLAVKFPLVLIKVLGRFKERSRLMRALTRYSLTKYTVDVDTHPMRGHNGTRDHLWLAQDLWTEDAVFKWIENDPVVMASVLRECGDPMCKKKERARRAMAQVRWMQEGTCGSFSSLRHNLRRRFEQWYCSRDCQKAHWRQHKEPCKKTQNFGRMIW
jgi:hypothetical protein